MDLPLQDIKIRLQGIVASPPISDAELGRIEQAADVLPLGPMRDDAFRLIAEVKRLREARVLHDALASD